MSLCDALDEAVGHMPWLTASDGAAVALARQYARQIDEVLEHGDQQEQTKALYLGPHLLNAIRALGGAPAERKALGFEEKARGKLAQLRAVREA